MKKTKAPKDWTQTLVEMDACKDAALWARQYPSLEEAWKLCERGDWMLWLVAKSPEGDRKKLVLAACECARLALPFVPDGDDRPRMAIATAERWAEGTATKAEVKSAASAASASSASASAAYASSAYASAYAASAATSSAAYAASAAASAASAASAATSAYAYASAAYASSVSSAYASDAYASYAAAYASYAAASDAASDASDAVSADILRQCADIVRKHFPTSPRLT